MHRLVAASSFGVLMITSSLAQDAGLGTPVITPPILSQPAAANQQLLVPPNQTNPAPVAQPPAASAPAPQAVAAPSEPETAEAAEPVNRAIATETFNEWTLECFEPAFDDGACQVVHRVISGNADQVVMVFALSARSEDDAATVQIALPLGISVPAGIQLTLGDGYQSQIDIQRCTPQGCIIEGTGSEDLLAALRREASGAIGVENEQGQQIQLPFSLQGSTAAYAEMIERNQS